MWRKLFSAVPALKHFKPPCRGFKSSPRSLKDFFEDLEDHLKSIRKTAMEIMPGSSSSLMDSTRGKPPGQADIVIIGGGVVGWSIAYWIKRRESDRGGLKVVVVEKDPTYSQASTVLSCGGIRQQFSLKENILLSMESADFLRNINDHLWVRNEEPIDLQFNHSGYLFLANEQCAPVMEDNFKIQRSTGANVELLSPDQLKERFPWMNTDGITLATLGVENEGWFDPWTLLNAFRRKAMSLGVQQIFGEVTGFRSFQKIVEQNGEIFGIRKIKAVNVQMPNSLEFYPVVCPIVVNAAGANSGKIAAMLGIGSGPENTIGAIPFPVEPRKRFVFVVHCPDGPGLETPFLIDYSGVYMRREGLGGNYLVGSSPKENEEPDVSNLDVDHEFFQEKVWPHLANRIPAFEELKVSTAWAGFYDYNAFDQNAILGIHPLVTNMYFATGFSGHGLQQSPAVGRAIAELIFDHKYKTLDLSALHPDRIIMNNPMLEKNIV